MKEYIFEAKILKHKDMDATYVEFPFDVQKEFGTKGGVKIRAEFEGHPYRGSLTKMSGGCHLLGLPKHIRAAIGKKAGDTICIKLIKDEEPREIAPPPDLAQALLHSREARSFFESLSYTNRKEYVLWIESAKKDETRRDRVKKSIELLKMKMKHP
jgi:hypothetical protein